MKTRKDILEDAHDEVLKQLVAAEVALEQLNVLQITILNPASEQAIREKIKVNKGVVESLGSALDIISRKLEAETKGDREKMLKSASEKATRRLKQLSND